MRRSSSLRSASPSRLLSVMVCVAVVFTCFTSLQGVHGYIYHLPNRTLGRDAAEDGNGDQIQLRALPLNEGPMFSLADAPFGNDEGYIRLSGEVHAAIDGTTSTVFNVLFFDENNEKTVGYYPGGPDPNVLQNRYLCCTHSRKLAGLCNTPGHVIVLGLNTNYTLHGFSGNLPRLHVYALNDPVTPFDDRYVVQRSGEQTALIVVCDTVFTLTNEVTFATVAEFHNPYGYVPGIKYGYLVSYGVLTMLYAVLFVGYIAVCVCYRRTLIPLQLGVASVMLMGLVEVCTWFATFTSKNATGVPVCDADDSCPPLTSDVMAAAVLSVAKGTVSRALLLVVCLGYGVVKPKLERRIVVLIVLLSVCHFGFGTVLKMVQSYLVNDLDVSMWSLPVMVFDIVYGCWIYQALETMRFKLRQERQAAKLAMYNSLATTLVVFVALAVVFGLFLTGVAFGLIPFTWKAAWAINNFWDVLYLGLLISITIIWAPGERTRMYSLYSQPTHWQEDDDGDVEMAGTGLGTLASSRSTPGQHNDGGSGGMESGFGAGAGAGDGGMDDGNALSGAFAIHAGDDDDVDDDDDFGLSDDDDDDVDNDGGAVGTSSTGGAAVLASSAAAVDDSDTTSAPATSLRPATTSLVST